MLVCKKLLQNFMNEIRRNCSSSSVIKVANCKILWDHRSLDCLMLNLTPKQYFFDLSILTKAIDITDLLL